MPSVERTVHTAAPIQTVYEYLRDFGNAEEWDAGTVSCTPIGSGPVAVGSQWHNVSTFRGRETSLTYTLEVDEPREHLRIVGRNKTVTSQDDLTFGTDDTGTTVSYRATFTFHGAAKLASPLLVPALGRLADDAAKTLHDALAKLPAS